MVATVSISSIIETDHNSLMIVFDGAWYQEDIEQLTHCVYCVLDETGHDVKKIEHVKGADREYCRFIWQEIECSLNFECYSQSCWIELEPQDKPVSLSTLKVALLAKL